MALTSNATVDGARFARDVRIDKVELASFSASQQDVIDLKYTMEQIDIFESIFEPKVSGTIVLRDGMNLIAALPLVGQEKLSIRWKSATLTDWVEKDFFVYKISDRAYFPNHSQQYSLSFVSNEHKRNSFLSVSQYYDGPFSEIVKNVLTSEDYINTKKTLNIEESKRSFRIVIPSWKPFALINWLATRSISNISNSPTYMFWETLDGYNFRSMADIISKSPKQNYIVEYQNVKAVADNDQQWKDMFRSTEFYSVSASFDTIANIQEGMFSSELNTYDVVTRKMTTTTYDYARSFVDHPHLYGNKLYAEVDRFDDKYVGKPAAYRNFMVVTDQAQAGVNGFFPEEWRLQRQSYLRQLMTLPLTLTVPGDSSRRCGDVVEFTFPSSEPPREGRVIEDKYLTGKYIVTEIHHIIKNDDYRMQLTLHKDSLFTKLALSDRSVLTEQKELDTQIISV